MAALCDGTITQTFLLQQATSAPRSTVDISPLRVLLFVLCVLLRLRFICSFLFSWFCCFGVLFCFVLFCLLLLCWGVRGVVVVGRMRACVCARAGMCMCTCACARRVCVHSSARASVNVKFTDKRLRS